MTASEIATSRGYVVTQDFLAVHPDGREVGVIECADDDFLAKPCKGGRFCGPLQGRGTTKAEALQALFSVMDTAAHDPDILFGDTLDNYIKARWQVDRNWQVKGKVPYADSFELEGDNVLIDIQTNTRKGTRRSRVEVPIAVLQLPDWTEHLAQYR
jgi:hypothetical protein